MLNLTRPLVFFDLETTGVNPFEDKIVQIGAIKIMPDGSEIEKEWLVNPGRPIPKVTSDIHGITDDMVADKPFIGDLAEELSTFFYDVDLGGYNVKGFDFPMLQAEFTRIGLELDSEKIKFVDPMQIFRNKEPRTLTAAYKKYCGKELVDAHNAIIDIRATFEVFKGQQNMYDDLPNTVEAIHEYTYPKDPNSFDAENKLRYVDGDLTINFGKNKGKTLHDLALNDAGYLEWILKGTFSDKVKDAVKSVLGYN